MALWVFKVFLHCVCRCCKASDITSPAHYPYQQRLRYQSVCLWSCVRRCSSLVLCQLARCERRVACCADHGEEGVVVPPAAAVASRAGGGGLHSGEPGGQPAAGASGAALTGGSPLHRKVGGTHACPLESSQHPDGPLQLLIRRRDNCRNCCPSGRRQACAQAHVRKYRHCETTGRSASSRWWVRTETPKEVCRCVRGPSQRECVLL